MDNDHWSRFCGTGIGLSNHKNQYTTGTLIGNWSENEAGNSIRETTNESALKFTATTTNRDHYQVREGESASRIDPPIDVERNLLFGHGEYRTYNATMYDLGYAHPKAAMPEKRTIDKFLWTGSKHNDLNVPGDLQGSTAKLDAAARRWSSERAHDTSNIAHQLTHYRRQFIPASDTWRRENPPPNPSALPNEFTKLADVNPVRIMGLREPLPVDVDHVLGNMVRAQENAALSQAGGGHHRSAGQSHQASRASHGQQTYYDAPGGNAVGQGSAGEGRIVGEYFGTPVRG